MHNAHAINVFSPAPINMIQFLGITGATALTSAAAATLVVSDGRDISRTLLVTAVIVGTTATVSLFAFGRAARRRRLETLLLEISRKLPILEENDRRSSMINHEILDAIRRMNASYDPGGDSGGDSGPHHIYS